MFVSSKIPTRNLYYVIVVAPAICVFLSIALVRCAILAGWNWKGIVCGFGSVLLVIIGIRIIVGICQELKRRKISKT
jgi:uncharacterized membrane protein